MSDSHLDLRLARRPQVMVEAVARPPVDLERVSLKGGGDALRQNSEALALASNQKMRRQL